MPLNAAPDHPIAAVDKVGIAVKRVRPTQDHIGVIFQSDSSGLTLCHLAWHHDLRFEAASDAYKWVDLGDVDSANKAVVAAFFEVLRREDPNISYGFDVEGDCFDDSGHFIPPPIGKGLTCATFVLAALKHQGFDLIDRSTWPDRPEDAQWQAGIIEDLRAYAKEEHVDALAKDIGAARIKPNEVAAAAMLADWPASFDDISALAAEVLQDLAY